MIIKQLNLIYYIKLLGEFRIILCENQIRKILYKRKIDVKKKTLKKLCYVAKHLHTIKQEKHLQGLEKNTQKSKYN
jgi:hypothetical protein